MRNDVAMTGEITLRGKVLPVGGIKEKVLAARRAGITTVILPRRNESDLEDIPPEVRSEMETIFVDTVDEVIARLARRRRRPAARRTSPHPPRTHRPQLAAPTITIVPLPPRGKGLGVRVNSHQQNRTRPTRPDPRNSQSQNELIAFTPTTRLFPFPRGRGRLGKFAPAKPQRGQHVQPDNLSIAKERCH